VFQRTDDDPRNPGDGGWPGDMPGTRLARTAAGFETYGVTGVGIDFVYLPGVAVPPLPFAPQVERISFTIPRDRGFCHAV